MMHSKSASKKCMKPSVMFLALSETLPPSILTTVGVSAILAIALACWAFIMARNPTHWRRWWMTQFGMADLNSSREVRRQQERLLTIGSSVVCLLAFTISLSFTVWTKLTIDDIRAKATASTQSSSKSRNVAIARPQPAIKKPGATFIP
jgi:Zn-dependent alcohol dehydrogenase